MNCDSVIVIIAPELSKDWSKETNEIKALILWQVNMNSWTGKNTSMITETWNMNYYPGYDRIWGTDKS